MEAHATVAQLEPTKVRPVPLVHPAQSGNTPGQQARFPRRFVSIVRKIPPHLWRADPFLIVLANWVSQDLPLIFLTLHNHRILVDLVERVQI